MTAEVRYPYVEVDVLEENADEAGALLFELGALGVEQRDAATLFHGSGSAATLIASFEGSDRAKEAIAKLPAQWLPRFGEVVGDSWRDEWKKHFEPFAVCEGVVVRPPWHPCDPGHGQKVVVLEPGRAFGTGLHETTSLVAQILAERVDRVRGRSVLDVGCGSGILALVALELGAASARAIDVDPEAVLVARENAEQNGRSGQLRVDGAAVSEVDESYDVVLANIEAAPLTQMAPALASRVASGGWLVLSGILAVEVDPTQWESVRQAYQGLHLEELRTKGEWLAAVLRT
jgi:ribosomal protein L11 methyltransferase